MATNEKRPPAWMGNKPIGNNVDERRQPPAWMNSGRNEVQKTKGGPAGYYQTGDNERKVFTQGGRTVRMAPNSTMTPAPRLTPMQNLINSFEQSAIMRPFYSPPAENGQTTGVRGALPNPYKAASPTPYQQGIGASGSMGARTPPAWMPDPYQDARRLGQAMSQYNLDRLLHPNRPLAPEFQYESYSGRG